MSKIIAYCGLNCSDCPAYIATQNNDTIKLKEIAKKWSNEKMQFNANDILCDGCHSDDRIFQWCKECDIKSCAREKGLKNCAYCGDYPCELLNNAFGKNIDSSAKQNLDNIRKNIEVQS
ncbi:MAG: DUF3795 domain-containing protein [Candidatus Odinarchaeota archaeon]